MIGLLDLKFREIVHINLGYKYVQNIVDCIDTMCVTRASEIARENLPDLEVIELLA